MKNKIIPFHTGDLIVSILIFVVIGKNILSDSPIYGVSAWIWLIIFMAYIIALWIIRRKNR